MKNSSEYALIHLTNKVAIAIDENKLTANVFLDLSKAFQTIDREILFYKLEHCGICCVVLSWMRAIWRIEKTSFSLGILNHMKPLFAVEYHRALFWDRYCSLFTLTIIPISHAQQSQNYLRTTRVFTIPIVILSFLQS